MCVCVHVCMCACGDTFYTVYSVIEISLVLFITHSLTILTVVDYMTILTVVDYMTILTVVDCMTILTVVDYMTILTVVDCMTIQTVVDCMYEYTDISVVFVTCLHGQELGYLFKRPGKISVDTQQVDQQLCISTCRLNCGH